MARADRRRTSRPTPAARARSEYAGIEDQLFFSRLRSHAKIGFVFLALVFGVGFVAFGVGSEFGGGIADVIQGRSASDQISVDEARERVAANPRDREALRDLSAALQREGRPNDAIPPLERYMRLNPEDSDALRELASLYVGKATRLRNEAAEAQAAGQIVTPDTLFTPADSQLGQALPSGAVRGAIGEQAQERLTESYTAMQAAYREAQNAYVRLARLTPEDASVQLQLADAAVNGGDVEAALAAYRRFLELAPDDPSAQLVREEIKRLESETPTIGG
jgi:tetratricopeptide (TPR) repeat protein